MDYKWVECLNWTKCAENYLYTFTYVQYKQKYTNIFLHTLIDPSKSGMQS